MKCAICCNCTISTNHYNYHHIWSFNTYFLSWIIHPNKNKSINIQGLILLVNLTILYTTCTTPAALYNTSIVITVNVMIGCALLQFSVIVLYHFVTFALHWNIIDIFHMVKGKVMNKFCTTTSHENTVLFNIPERTFNYNEYREGLTSDDFI